MIGVGTRQARRPPSGPRVVALVALTELRRRLRDRSLLITGLIAPFGLAAIMGLAFHPASRGPLIRLGIDDAATTPTARAIVDSGLESAALPAEIGLVSMPSESAERQALSSGRIEGWLYVPPTFARPGPAGPGRRLVTGTPRDAPLAQPALEDVVRAIDSRFTVGRLSLLAEGARATAAGTSAAGPEATGPEAGGSESVGLGSAAANGRGSPDGGLTEAGRGPSDGTLTPAVLSAAAASPPLVVRDEGRGGGQSLVGYFAPSMAIVFLFIGVGAVARSVLAERQVGTVARLAAAPVRAASVVGGKLAGLLLVALAGIFILWGATTLAFGADWGRPGPVAVMCVMTAVAISALALLITGFARDQGQADTATLVVGLVLALLGGNFFPPGSLPTALADLSRATPNGWSLQGFGSLAIDRAGWAAVWGPTAALGLFAVICVGVAGPRLRDLLVPR